MILVNRKWTVEKKPFNLIKIPPKEAEDFGKKIWSQNFDILGFSGRKLGFQVSWTKLLNYSQFFHSVFIFLAFPINLIDFLRPQRDLKVVTLLPTQNSRDCTSWCDHVMTRHSVWPIFFYPLFLLILFLQVQVTSCAFHRQSAPLHVSDHSGSFPHSTKSKW